MKHSIKDLMILGLEASISSLDKIVYCLKKSNKDFITISELKILSNGLKKELKSLD